MAEISTTQTVTIKLTEVEYLALKSLVVDTLDLHRSTDYIETHLKNLREIMDRI